MERGRQPVSRGKSVQLSLFSPSLFRFERLRLRFLSESAAILSECNDRERESERGRDRQSHKRRVFSIHGLTGPYSLYLALAADITKMRNAST